MRTIILAAGRGSRLGPLTDQRPKSLVPLAGIPMLTRLLNALRTAGLSDITIVTGYQADLIGKAAPDCRTLHSPRWAQTNMAASLLVAADAGLLEDGAVISYSDIVVEPRVLTTLLSAPPAPLTLPVNTAWLDVWSERMTNPSPTPSASSSTPTEGCWTSAAPLVACTRCMRSSWDSCVWTRTGPDSSSPSTATPSTPTVQPSAGTPPLSSAPG